MRILLDIFLLIAGFVLLIKSADVFVSASVEIAKRLKIPKVIIALTVMAMGTSLPELVISVSAAIGGSGDLAVANVVGSNIFNLLFIVGLCALLYPIDVNLSEISRDYWISVAATVLFFAMVIVSGDTIPRLGSFILLAGFLTYMALLVRFTLKTKPEDDDARQSGGKARPLALSVLFAVLSAAAIVAGGQLTVLSAVDIALAIGITERVIGLTVVAMGTSLPELVTTLIAARKKEGEFALGFIIGSSIFNIMFVPGLAGLITPLTVESGVVFDLALLTAGTLLLFLFARSGKRIVRLEGLAMVMVYLGYMAFVILL
ncbi:MAG: calcium/sodium antiporter [Treponema sp.]|nr:calcium/sodium antiporter [Treponema sp.]